MKQHMFKHASTHDTQANNCRFDSHHSFPWNATSEMASFVQALTGYIFNHIIDNEYSSCATATNLTQWRTRYYQKKSN
jgi:hypothetical protein